MTRIPACAFVNQDTAELDVTNVNQVTGVIQNANRATVVILVVHRVSVHLTENALAYPTSLVVLATSAALVTINIHNV